MMTGKGGLAVCFPEPDWQYAALAGRLYHQTDRKRGMSRGFVRRTRRGPAVRTSGILSHPA